MQKFCNGGEWGGGWGGLKRGGNYKQRQREHWKTMLNKTLGRARDPRANSAWLKLTE